MKNKKSYVYIGLPVLGMIFIWHISGAPPLTWCIPIISGSSIPICRTCGTRIKFFVADLLTRIPVNFLERGLNVMIFGYSVTVDRIMGILGFGLSALVIGRYSRKKGTLPGLVRGDDDRYVQP